jgi:murein DD-endopeptidase MepM/ murein hydrolase activator NlpD
MADGQILTAGYQRGYGKLVVIRHPDGCKTVYGHLSKIAKEVIKGSDVTQGQIIGFVGSTGLSTGPHLHYETRVSDRPVNPLKVKIPNGRSVPEARITAQAKAGGETDGPLIIERRGNRYVRIQ